MAGGAPGGGAGGRGNSESGGGPGGGAGTVIVVVVVVVAVAVVVVVVVTVVVVLVLLLALVSMRHQSQIYQVRTKNHQKINQKSIKNREIDLGRGLGGCWEDLGSQERKKECDP